MNRIYYFFASLWNIICYYLLMDYHSCYSCGKPTVHYITIYINRTHNGFYQNIYSCKECEEQTKRHWGEHYGNPMGGY